MGYSDNASRHQGVDREARYFSSLLGKATLTIGVERTFPHFEQITSD